MRTYLDALEYILDHGSNKKDRTGTGTISHFGYQMRFDLNEGFPLMTTKKMKFENIAEELLWFIRGETNIRTLIQKGVNIWNEWPYKNYLKKCGLDVVKPGSKEWDNGIQLFKERIADDEEFAQKWGNLGPVYGKQWRNFNGVDQLQSVIQQIKSNPESRRLIVSAWNPSEIEEMAKAGLPPCHTMFQFYVINGKLSCQLYQRSADLFLGVPYNIASYALLTHIVAHLTDLEVGEFIHTFGDIHIYKNHIEQVEEQLSRSPYALPKLTIHSKAPQDLAGWNIKHFCLSNYECHEAIKAPIAV